MPGLSVEFRGFRSGERHSRNLMRGECIAGAADLIEAGDAGFDRRKGRRSRVGFGLIPVGDGEEIVGSDVGVAVFDRSAQGFREWNGRVEMEAVDGASTSGVFFAFYGRAHQAVGEGM